MTQPERYRLTIEAPAVAGWPVEVRLRRFLKVALRAFRIRCVRIELAEDAPPSKGGCDKIKTKKGDKTDADS